MEKFVSIDIGGTAIKYGVIDSMANIISKGKMDTQASKGGQAILQKVISIVNDYVKDYDISGVCISTAGMVDSEKGEIFYSGPTIPNYIGVNFKNAIFEKFALPCEVENDVNCAGLCEFMSGAASGSKIALMLTIGTGIGGCAIIDGKVFHGANNCACEIGYMNMFGTTFQKLGAASVLTQRVAELKNESADNWNGIRIFDEARNNDSDCIKAIDEMVDVLGMGIANICYVLNPEVVVLGGGIMAEQEYLRKRLEKALNNYLVPSLADCVRIEFAKNKNDAGILGAFYNYQQIHS